MMQNLHNKFAFCASFSAVAASTRANNGNKRCVLSRSSTASLPLLQASTFTQQRLDNATRDRMSALRTTRRAKVTTYRSPTCMFPGNIEDIPLEPVPWTDAQSVPAHWHRPGVYGVYASDGSLQFVASSIDVGNSISGHKKIIKKPELVHAARMLTVDSVNDAPLDDFAQAWVTSYHEAKLPIPPGNSDEMPQWRDEPINPDVCFTGSIVAGSPEQRVKLEIEDILARYRCVLFMKGTSQIPQCGFSKAILELMSSHLNLDEGEFVCVNCLDTNKNLGLREGIKQYSNWPTIPQLYVNGEFVGGVDIVYEMSQNGELEVLLNS